MIEKEIGSCFFGLMVDGGSCINIWKGVHLLASHLGITSCVWSPDNPQTHVM